MADLYGTSNSPLHLGLTTDRLIVSVRTETSGVKSRPSATATASTPLLTAFPRLDDLTLSLGDRLPENVLIEIPGDVVEVLARSATSARTWRLAVRDHFQWALSRGYTVAGVHRNAASERSFYLVARGDAGAPALAAG